MRRSACAASKLLLPESVAILRAPELLMMRPVYCELLDYTYTAR